MMTHEDISRGPLRLDEKLFSMSWSTLLPVSEFSLGDNDCIVVGAGFEDRALAGLKRACQVSTDFNVVLVLYLPMVEENQGLDSIEYCKYHGLNFQTFSYDRESPSGMGVELSEHVERFDRVILDISGMSRLLIVQTIVALVGLKKEFNVLYTEAEIYPPLEQEYSNSDMGSGSIPSFISSGIFEVVSTPELSSVSMLGSAIRLVSFPTFDYIQLSNLVQEIQPTHNDIIHGVPPSKEMTWRTDAIKQLNEPTIRGLQRVQSHSASTLDYRDTLNLILDIYRKFSVFDRIVIAPTGSKMQSVAVGILRGILTDLQIVYPTPLKFVDPEHYTEGVKQMYLLKIDDIKLPEGH